MHIYNLENPDNDKSLNGAFIKVVAYNSAGDSEPQVFRLQIEHTANYYTSKEGQINWTYGLNSNGEITSLYTEDDNLSSIIENDGVLHIPAIVNDLVVRGIG